MSVCVRTCVCICARVLMNRHHVHEIMSTHCIYLHEGTLKLQHSSHAKLIRSSNCLICKMFLLLFECLHMLLIDVLLCPYCAPQCAYNIICTWFAVRGTNEIIMYTSGCDCLLVNSPGIHYTWIIHVLNKFFYSNHMM